MYMEIFSLALTTKEIERTTYDIFGVFGYVGGISSVLITIATFIAVPYSQLSF